MKEELNKGILYLCVHKKMEDKITNNSRILSKKDFNRMLGETFHIPKNMRIIVLKEMEQKGLVKDLGATRNSNIKVLKVGICIQNDVNKLYKFAGLF